MKVSLIMPFYGKWPMVLQRLNEFYKYVRPSNPIEIILINDKPGDNTPNGNIGMWQKMGGLDITYVKNKENLGFGGSMNKGAKKANGKILVFFSSDVVVTGDFIPSIVGMITMDKNILIGGRYLDFNTGWNQMRINGKTMLFPYVEGWLMACHKSVWKDLGGFDPIYGKFDVEDVDISTTAIHKGYKLIGLDSPYLRHMSGVTIRDIYPDRERYTKSNIKRFKEKWSKILE